MDDQVNENKSNAESVVSVGLTVPYVLVQAIPTVSSPSRKRRSLSSAIGRLKRLKLLKEQKPYCESNVPPVDVDVTTSVINTQSGSESEEYTGCNDGVGNHHDSEISALSTTAIMITTDGATFDQMNAITKGHHYSLTFQNNPVKSQTISLNDGSVLNEINNQVNDNNIGSINCSANNMSNEKQDLSEGKIFTNGQNSESDDYCWICHNPGEVVICSCCPRVFHSSCLYMTDFPDVWLCPECQDLILAECSLYQLKSWCTITNDQLKRMLLFLLDRLSRQSWFISMMHQRPRIQAIILSVSFFKPLF
ncbi:Protein kinase C-binding protein 1 [Schistosoma japonicum]|nr:Protein kinase C-binding protein 1 [Schistosoma japonicum]